MQGQWQWLSPMHRLPASFHEGARLQANTRENGSATTLPGRSRRTSIVQCRRFANGALSQCFYSRPDTHHFYPRIKRPLRGWGGHTYTHGWYPFLWHRMHTGVRLPFSLDLAPSRFVERLCLLANGVVNRRGNYCGRGEEHRDGCYSVLRGNYTLCSESVVYWRHCGWAGKNIARLMGTLIGFTLPKRRILSYDRGADRWFKVGSFAYFSVLLFALIQFELNKLSKMFDLTDHVGFQLPLEILKIVLYFYVREFSN